jgi:hypothetical protein
MRIATWSTLACAFTALAWAFLFAVLSKPNWDDVWSAIGIAGLSLILFIAALVLRSIQVFGVLRAERKIPDASDIDEICKASKQIYDRVPYEAASAFLGALLRPQTYIQRITESVDLHEGHVAVSTTYTVDLAKTISTGAQYFPIDLIERGVLADGLKLTDNDNKRVSSIIRLAATSYLLAVSRRLIEKAGGSSATALYEKKAERGVAEVIASHAPVDAIVFFETVADLSDIANDLAEPNKKYIYEVIGMLFLLRPWYPLLVDVHKWSNAESTSGLKKSAGDVGTTANDELSISPVITSYTRFQVAQNRILKRRLLNRLAGVGDFFRNFRLLLMFIFGVYNNDVLVPLDNAERALSYHLQTNGVEGTYLGDQHLEQATNAGVHQIKPRQGQNYSRLYVSQGHDYRGRTFQSWFFETPPGSVGIATGIAFASLFGLVLLGVSQLHWISSGPINAFSLLLGFPGAILGFLGLGRTGGFFRGSLRARISNIASLGAALTGLACAALVARSTNLTGAHLIASDLHLLPPALVFWSVLLGLQAINLVIIFFIWLYRVFVYWSTVTN